MMWWTRVNFPPRCDDPNRVFGGAPPRRRAHAGRAELDVLAAKMSRRHGFSRLGLFVAWNGVTKPFAQTAMYDQSKVIVAVDRQRLSDLVAAADRPGLLDKWIRAAVTGVDFGIAIVADADA